MPHVSLPVGRAVRATALLCGVLSALVPAAAMASTYTVDDDKQQCPNASFTSIQAAVDQAAPHDTVVVCAGLYKESSTPTNNAASPAAAGSHNGLTIQKPLTIRGAGASKVTIEPNPSLGGTLAGTTPYLRDGGGNVITISRQSLGSTDAEENGVDISGVTVTSPSTYAEAGIAYFNTSGTVSDSVVGPLASPTATGGTLTSRPYGWGIVETDSLQGAGTGTARRRVTVSHSLVTGYQAGGILFDDGFGADGAATNLQRSGIIQYGYVDHTRVEGRGPTSIRPQTGIAYHAGQRGSVVASEVTGNYYTPAPSQSYGLLLTDAETLADPNTPGQLGFWATGNSFTGNGYALFNADTTGTTVRSAAPALATGPNAGDENWWGCAFAPVAGTPAGSEPGDCQSVSGPDATPAASVTVGGTPAATAPAALSVPATPADDAPDVSIVDPLDNASVPANTTINPVVVASDDFGVKSVKLTADATTVATDGHTPYEFTWTPTSADVGKTIALTATVTDSAGQTATDTVHVKVPIPAGYTPITVAPDAIDFGALLVGAELTKPVTISNTGTAPLTLTGLDVSGSGFAVLPGTGAGACTATTTLASGTLCKVDVGFTPVAAAAHAGYLKVSYTAAGAAGPVTVALTGTGVAPQDTSGGGSTTGAAATTTTITTTTPTIPALTGVAHVGQTLTCTVPAGSGAATFAWNRDGSAIAGEKGATYTLKAADVGAEISCSATTAAGTGTSGAVSVRYARTTTATKVTVQLGGALLALARHPKGTSKLAIGTLTCAHAAATSCTLTLSGTLKVGRTTFKVSGRTKLTGHKAKALLLTLSGRAAKALKGHHGTLKLKATVTDSTGAKGSATTTLTTAGA